MNARVRGWGLAGAVTLLLILGPVPAAVADCSQAERTGSDCSYTGGHIDDNQVTIRAESVQAGTSGSSGSSSQSSSSQSSGSASSTATPRPAFRRSPPPPPRLPVLGSRDCQVKVAGLCRGQAPAKNPPSPPRSTPPPAVVTPPTPPQAPRQASDLRSFSPNRPGLAVQPGEWTMPRLPTNFVAQASEHTQRGSLLGWPVEVRFRPVRFAWSFGDGQHSTWSFRGSTWSALGQRQFTPTSTSHVYAAPGSYTVGLRVFYTVDFRFVGQSWTSLRGEVNADAPSARVRVLTVSPLLVEAE